MSSSKTRQLALIERASVVGSEAANTFSARWLFVVVTLSFLALFDRLGKHAKRLRPDEHVAGAEGKIPPLFLADLPFDYLAVVGPYHFQSGDGSHWLYSTDGGLDGPGSIGEAVEIDFMRPHITDRRPIRNAALLAKRQVEIPDLHPAFMDPAVKQIHAAS